MQERDLETVLRIEKASFSVPWSRNSFLSLLHRHDADLWVAVIGGEVRGYAAVWYMSDEAELGNLAVDPDWRREGIGSLLLGQTLTGARVRGARRLYLEVRSSNRAAQSLYERHGFVMAGIRRRYYRSPVEDARVMRVDLGLGAPGAEAG